MERRYFVLISISHPRKEHGQIINQLKAACTEPPKIVWQEKSTIGFGAVSTLPAYEIGIRSIKGQVGIDNMTVLELGASCAALPDSVFAGWLNSHRPPD